MAVVKLASPLRELAGGSAEVRVDGSTVGEVIARLERSYPRLAGWVLDEQRRIRRHVVVFLNGERAGEEAGVSTDDRMHVLPSISGGAVTAVRHETELLEEELMPEAEEEPIELLIGTRKGLFILRGRRGRSPDEAHRKFSGQVVEYAIKDRRTDTYFASVTHGQFGPRLYYTQDPVGEWEQADGPAFPEGEDASVERIWVVEPGLEEGVLWAGVAPAALFKSEDGGKSWALNRALWDNPSRKDWQPGAGGLCLHSICTWPGEPSKLAVGISAAGVWLSDDGGESWRRGVKGLVPRYVPEEARADATDLCVHKIRRPPLQPNTLYLQFHGGVYRSDDAGETWQDIGSGGGLPSDFGFPLVIDPADPDRAFVIPLRGDFDRVTPEGRVRVFETRDRGETWWPLTEGLPQQDSFLTVLRQAFTGDGKTPLGLYFGAESGEVFGSIDGGATWFTVIERLPPVVAVNVTT